MAQVLNIKERNQAFAQFFIFFVISVTLIVGAVYFNFRVPVNENESLREKISLQHQDDYNQEKFVAQMTEAAKYLDSLGKNDINLLLLDIQLAGKLSDLEKLRQRDTTAYGKLNKTVVDAFLELQAAKKELLDLRKNVKRLEETEGKLTACQERLAGYYQNTGSDAGVDNPHSEDIGARQRQVR